MQLQSARGQLVFALMPVLPAMALRWWTRQRLRAMGELLFQDVEEAPIVSLRLTVDRAAQTEVVVSGRFCDQAAVGSRRKAIQSLRPSGYATAFGRAEATSARGFMARLKPCPFRRSLGLLPDGRPWFRDGD